MHHKVSCFVSVFIICIQKEKLMLKTLQNSSHALSADLA